MFLSNYHQIIKINSKTKILLVLVFFLGLFSISEITAAEFVNEADLALAMEAELAEITADLTVTDISLRPTVSSKIFTNQEIWYSTKEGLFTWQLPSEITALAVEIATSSENRPNNNPDSIYEIPIAEFLVTPDQLIEGVQYLSLRFRVDKQWGEILNQKILIDTEPPTLPEIKISVPDPLSGFPTLFFEANDVTSGIDYYQITINNATPQSLTPNQATDGYVLEGLENGIYELEVTAYDQAGNFATNKITIPITAGWVRSVPETTNNVADYMTDTNLVILALLVVIVGLIIIMYFERKYINLREIQLRRETSEAQEQTLKIFTALRGEIYDQINNINSKKRLSKGEKEAVAGLTEALDISKTLIAKEISDVEKILQ